MVYFIRVSQGSFTLVVVVVVGVFFGSISVVWLARWKWYLLIDEENMALKLILFALWHLKGRFFSFLNQEITDHKFLLGLIHLKRTHLTIIPLSPPLSLQQHPGCALSWWANCKQ